MEARDCLRYLTEQVHTTVVATVDDDGLPVTAAIDMMDADETGLYFLTAMGKGFYRRLKARGYLALTGTNGADTMHCVAVSVRGRVTELGPGLLGRLFEKNPYMAEIYPTEASRAALTVFKIDAGSGEWFDLSKRPIERFSFAFGGEAKKPSGYRITDACTACGACLAVCPQSCITPGAPYRIEQTHCLHCGNCLSVCPVGAVRKENA